MRNGCGVLAAFLPEWESVNLVSQINECWKTVETRDAILGREVICIVEGHGWETQVTESPAVGCGSNSPTWTSSGSKSLQKNSNLRCKCDQESQGEQFWRREI